MLTFHQLTSPYLRIDTRAQTAGRGSLSDNGSKHIHADGTRKSRDTGSQGNTAAYKGVCQNWHTLF